MSGPDVSIPAFLPFYLHLAPAKSVEDALRGPLAAAVDPGHLEEVLDQAWNGLLSAVEGQCFRTVIGEFHSFRESRELPMDAGGDEALQLFRRHLEQAENCEQILDRYSVLKQRLASMLRNLLDAYTDLFTAFAEDRELLESAGLVPGPGEADLIEKIFLTGSDPHNDNRQVIQVRLVSGTRLVFKPRPLISDCFVKELYEAAGPYLKHSLNECIPVSVTAGSHGWQQFVRSAAMETQDQPARYFYRFGALCAVFGALGASDMHDENLLACGEIPSVIDTETMLRADAGVENDTLPHVLVNHMKLSVVSTMLVPVVNPTSPIDIVMAGVGVAEDQSSKLKRATVRDGAADSISVVWEPVTYKHHGNVPRLGGTRLVATDHFEDILAGYLDALEFVRSGNVEKVLDRYPDMGVRSLLRSTMVYSRFLDASTHPKYLGREEEAARLLGLLARMPDYLSSEAADYVAEEERASLATGNVPYFMTRSGTTELATLKTQFLRRLQDLPGRNGAQGDRTQLLAYRSLPPLPAGGVLQRDGGGEESGRTLLGEPVRAAGFAERPPRIVVVRHRREDRSRRRSLRGNRRNGNRLGVRNRPRKECFDHHPRQFRLVPRLRRHRHLPGARRAVRQRNPGHSSERRPRTEFASTQYGRSLWRRRSRVFTGASSMLLTQIARTWIGNGWSRFSTRSTRDPLRANSGTIWRTVPRAC